MKIREFVTVGAFVVAVGLLSACGAGPVVTVTGGPSDQPIAAPTDAEVTDTDSEAEEGGSEASQDVTPAGTVLAIGEDAIVDYRIWEFPNGLDQDPVISAPGQVLLRLAITSVTPASVDDLPADTIITGTTEDKLSVVEVRYETQAIGTPGFPMERRGVVWDFDPDGYNAFVFSDSQGEIPGCLNASYLGPEFDAGQVVEGCFLVAYLTASGTPNITYKPHDDILDVNPLVWTTQ